MNAAAANPDTGPRQIFAASGAEDVRYADDAARERLAPLLGGGASAQAEWVLVKHNVSRTVYRCDAGSGTLYLKHFHSRSAVHRLQRRLGFSDAMCEMEFSRHLTAGGVPVPRVLATHCRRGVEWIVTEGVAPAEPADEWHRRQLAEGRHAAVRAATVAMARLIGQMHARGVLHRDLHCGNVLVRTDGDGVSLTLMDLHRMRRRGRLSRRSRAANLAQLYHDRRLWTTRTQRLRFLRHYLRASAAEGALRGWVRLIEPMARRHSRRLYAQRDRRILANNRYFARVEARGYQGQVVLASKRRVPGSRAAGLVFSAADWREALADPAALLTGDGVTVVKDSASGLIVRRTLRVGAEEIDVYVKRPRRKRAIRWVLDLFRPSRSLRAFRLGHSLLARHIYSALPLAALEKRRCRFLLDSILITEAVGADRPAGNVRTGMQLNRFLSRCLGPGKGDREDALSASDRRRLAQHGLWQLGRLLRRLHEEGFAHRDLKASNLLVHWDGRRTAPPEIILIDLDGVSRVRRVSTRQQYRGLMRLNVSLLECPFVSHAGRLRMLLGYLRRPGVGRINFKPSWRVLQRWSGKKIRRQIASRQKRQQAQRRSKL